MNKKHTYAGIFRSRLLWLSLVVIVLVLGVFIIFYINKGPEKDISFKGVRNVTIQNRNGRYNFYKKNIPFMVKGGAGFTHLQELVSCGGNTIICWDTSKLENTFKEAARYNISVIIGLDIPGGEDTEFYKDEKNFAATYDAYSKIVARYKDQSLLLAWCLGNELFMPVSLGAPPFYKAYNRLLGIIHQKDPHHPVATSTINVGKKNILNIQWRIPALDFICINTYNRIKTIDEDLNSIKLFWQGPYLIGEWSPNGGWEASLTTWQAPIENTSTQKAKQYYEFFTKHMPYNDPRFLGSLVFYWGNRQEYTPTWYSIFNEENSPTEIMEVMNDCWKDTVTKHKAPQLRHMLIDNLGANDNIIISAGSQHQASVLLEKRMSADTLQYEWQILKEDWQYWGQTWNNFKKPPVQKGLIPDSTQQNIRFKAPPIEGPYRVFVTVYNAKGYCAAANIPIYVVQ